MKRQLLQQTFLKLVAGVLPETEILSDVIICVQVHHPFKDLKWKYRVKKLIYTEKAVHGGDGIGLNKELNKKSRGRKEFQTEKRPQE